MIGNSVVPGLPNRCVTPSSLSNARNAERPVMRFMKVLPCPRPLPSGSGQHDRSCMVRSMDGAHGCHASLDLTPRASSEQPVMIDAFLPFRALPDHAGKALQRHQRLAGVGPLLQLFDGNMIERLAPGAAGEKRARDVHHVRRTRALKKQRHAAPRAKAPHDFRGLVLEARDPGLALDDPESLAPASDIGRVGRAMRAPACGRMIVPGPACRHIDLEADLAAQALTWGYSRCCRCPCHLRFPSQSSLRGAE